MKSETKTAAILGTVILVAIIGISITLSTLDDTPIKKQDGKISSIIDKSGFKKAPKLVGIAEYINTTPENLDDEISDKVVLYDIWTYSCINCIRTIRIAAVLVSDLIFYPISTSSFRNGKLAI